MKRAPGYLGIPAALLLLPALQAATPQFTVLDLGQPSGVDVYPYGINDAGMIVGQLQSPGGAVVRAILYSDGAFSDLGTTGGSYGTSFRINEKNQIVGFTTNAGGQTNGTIWENGVATPLNTILHTTYSTSYDVNNRSQIVGHFQTTAGPAHGYLYNTRSGAVTDFGTLGGDYIEPRKIGDTGLIVGWSYLDPSRGPFHPFLYDGTLKDLGCFGTGDGAATWINKSNVIVGECRFGDGTLRRAFRKPLNGAMQDLGVGIWEQTRANCINNTGVIVGWAGNATQKVGVMYLGGKWVDLNTVIPAGSGWTIIEGGVINNSNQIAARGIFNGEVRVVRLDPVVTKKAR